MTAKTLELELELELELIRREIGTWKYVNAGYWRIIKAVQ